MRIIIEMEGGLIQHIMADDEADIIIRDLDTEGADEISICPPMNEDYVESYLRRERFDSDYLPYNDPSYAKEFDALWAHFDAWLRKDGE